MMRAALPAFHPNIAVVERNLEQCKLAQAMRGASGGGDDDTNALLALLGLGGGGAARNGGTAAGDDPDPLAALLGALQAAREPSIRGDEVGTIVQDDRDENPFKVRGPRGDTSWFREAQVQLAPGEGDGSRTRPTVGDKVVLS